VIVRIVNLAKRSAFMSQEKYIGMDVHQATISVAVMDGHGKLIMECLPESRRWSTHCWPHQVRDW
jgi:hypothetical protein